MSNASFAPPDIDTVPRLFRHAVNARGDAVMLRQKHLGVWKAWSWREVA
ncbi:MAG: long-chain fatty acid--CoA ligase, partial [Rhizobacter sp.]|nr:long-chain fatty acid--CoA ligase [Rhizobacter sp.]